MADPAWSAPLPDGEGTVGYTNSVTVGTTQWDVTLDFQFRTPVPGNMSGTDLTSQPVARLVMSPMHAKALAEVIGGAIRAWEHKFGPLPDADVLLPGLSASLAEAQVEPEEPAPREAKEGK